MATRATLAAALPAECAGGFKALRSHVKLTKEGGADRKSASPTVRENDKSEREQEWDGAKQLQPLECQGEARQNQERISQEEHHLHIIRLSLAKEQRDFKARERSVKAMEIALQDAMDRTAEKEMSLDQRIQDIARLEQRLHDALTQKSPPVAPDPQDMGVSMNPTSQALEELRCQLEEQQTTLALREQELAMARDRVSDRERHLATKERVLRDKASELSLQQSELEKKDQQRDAITAQRLAQMEHELQSRYETLERELVERFQQQLAGLTAEFEAKQAQLHERAAAADAENRDRTARIVQREEAAEQAEAALAAQRESVEAQRQALQVAEQSAISALEDAARHAASLEAQRGELAERIEEAHAIKRQYEEAEAKLKQQEAKLMVFAAEVEAQAQFNATQRRQLEDDRAAFDTRVATAANAPNVASANTAESMGPSDAPTEPPPTRETAKPARTRSFTSGLFRSKSTLRA